jgi:5'-nucleotidase/UDP-sugar diphosphatase
MPKTRLTILHSNDMHGDFLAEAAPQAERQVGGLPLLSGYINKVRQEESNVLFCIAGDMIQGSIIDSEYKGISTMEIMNYLSPDVATLGNHEFDYGLAHMLFLEKMANFPIVNANLYIRRSHKRLMKPYVILERAGLKILVIGILTEDVLDALRQDAQVSTLISLEEAAAEVGKICNAYRYEDIDLTILLTHVGFEADKELALLLKPEWGIDLIIGGHSHTVLTKPEEINDILIAQAGSGTNQIGRFDLVIDPKANRILEWTWALVPIDCETAASDKELEAYIRSYKQIVDQKYGTLISRLTASVTHPRRHEETALGNLLADALGQMSGVEIMLLGSGSIRAQELGPIVTLGDLRACFPYDDSLYRLVLSGEDLLKAFAHFMARETSSRSTEYYQVNGAIRAIYDSARGELHSLTFKGEPIQADRQYSVGLQGFHYAIAKRTLLLTEEQIGRFAPPKVVSTSVRDVLEEYLHLHQNIGGGVEGRLSYR